MPQNFPSIANTMTDTEVVARTLWAEARNGGREGMEDVGQVILNRVRNPRWWGNDIRSVCLGRGQFSCWWVKDDNYRKMLAANSTNTIYNVARNIAAKITSGMDVSPRVGGADHYYAPAGMVGGQPPRWADPSKLVYTSSHGHKFYQLEVRTPSTREETPSSPHSYIVATGTAAAGAVGTVAQSMGDLPWQVAVAMIVAVAIGFCFWRWTVAKKEISNAFSNN